MQVLSPFQTVCLRHLFKHSRQPVPEAAPRIPLLLSSQVYATQTATQCQSPLFPHSQRGQLHQAKSHVVITSHPSPLQCFRNLFLHISRKTIKHTNQTHPPKTTFLACQDFPRRVKLPMHFSRQTSISAVLAIPLPLLSLTCGRLAIG